ncbi:molybdopterin-guanine dinucleotide biosynthesis protein B [Pseudomonadota bacterium]
MSGPKHIIGLIGWSGSGKTTLVSDLIPNLIDRGLSVSTMKHTHHDFDMDQPGKDSYRHREAGAEEVLLTSARRWALLHELRDEPEYDMEALIAKMAPVDVLLIEGFKSHGFPKIEVNRPSRGKSVIAREDDTVIAVASDEDIANLNVPLLDLNDIEAIAEFIVRQIGEPT